MNERIPNHRMACTLEDLCRPDNTIECCHNCKHYAPSRFGSPGGWCGKYPSESINTSDPEVCDDFESALGGAE